MSLVSVQIRTHKTLDLKNYPRSKWYQFEDALDGKAKGEGEIHVAEDISKYQRSPMILSFFEVLIFILMIECFKKKEDKKYDYYFCVSII